MAENSVFRQRDIYRYVKRVGVARVSDISIALGMSRRSVSNALLRMGQQGILLNTGKTHNSRWRVAGPPPVDTRGMSAGSHANLRKNWDKWPELLAKANAANGRGPETVAKLLALSGRKGVRYGLECGVGESAPERDATPPAFPSLAELLMPRR